MNVANGESGAAPTARRGSSWLVFLLVLVPPLLLHLDHLGPGRIPYLRDLSRTHLPMKQLAVERMRGGHLPLWHPGHGAGSALLANANFFHFHPLTLLFLFLPYPTAFSLGLALLSVAGAAGTYLWLGRRGLAPEAAALGGVAFALGGLGASTANLYNLHASYAALPWILRAGERLSSAATGGNLALLALTLAAAAAGGEPTAWAWGALLVWVLGGRVGGKRVALARVAATALSLGLAAVQIVPLLAVNGASLRGLGFTLEESTRFSLPPERLLELAAPGTAGAALAPRPTPAGGSFDHLGASLFYSLYAGVAVLALAALGLTRPAPAVSWPQARLRLAAVMPLSIALALGGNTPLYPWLFAHLPPLHQFRYPEKLVLPFFLALAALAALGASRVRQRWLRMALVVAVAADLLHAHCALVPGAPAVAFLEPPPIARDLASRRTYFWVDRKSYVPPGAGLLDLHRAYVDRAVPPAGLLSGVAYLFDADADRLDPLRMVRLAQVVHAPAGRPRLLALAGVERVVSPRPIADLDRGSDLVPIGDDPLPSYAVRDPVPFARLVPSGAVLLVAGPEDAARALAEPGFDPRRVVAFEGAPPLGGGGSARFTRPDPETIEIDADGAGLLVVNEAIAPGWEAEVDGKPAALRPANLAFMGVPIAATGRHRVVLAYRPRPVAAGLALTALSLALVLALVLHDMRMRARKAATPSDSAPETT